MANQILPQTPKTYLRTITIIHIALFLGELMFAIVTLTITPNKGIDVSNTKDMFLFAVPLVAIASFVAGTFLYKKSASAAAEKLTLKDKLMGYQTALIQQYAMLQGACMFAIVVYMISGNLFYLIIAGLLMLLLLSKRPTKDKIENDLNLSYEDKMQFNSEDVLR